MDTSSTDRNIPEFKRDFFESTDDFTTIGNGEIGGKAQGLAFIQETLSEGINLSEFPDITVNIPRLTVVTTELFDSFLSRNKLHDIAFSDETDDRIASAFQKGDFPAEFIGDLMGLINKVKTPLAIRSSSLLEDVMYRPFAGVYATKMIPNNQFEPSKRFQKLIEAIKFVWASTFFKEAKSYINLTSQKIENEKMAVIIQEVVGQRWGDTYYPDISGVAKSFNFYPTGKAKPGDGVIDLALGLGRTIVDGGLSWTYSPAYPKANPPYANINESMKNSQKDFWAVNMGSTPSYDPIRETEYLIQSDLKAAEQVGTFKFLASTYNAASDRITPGIGVDGPRLINFSLILVHKYVPLNDLFLKLIRICEEKVGKDVEIEFAVTLDAKDGLPARVGFLQVRPMVVSDEKIDIEAEQMNADNVIIASDRVMGNGQVTTIRDIVYVKPDTFEAKHTLAIVNDLEKFNRDIARENSPYLLIGFGRWGSSDPWLGIPVNWSQVSNAKAIVEATLPKMNVDLSQGYHFFHNLSSFEVSYFSVQHTGNYQIDWEWLNSQKIIHETEHVRHIRLPEPLTVMVDGRSGKGIIYHA
ncbi:MAG: PEP/pyruvate-binding domain-containing protein [Candidatus Electryonea clarkiae]|nr:PEP/pyruvate-binding domain-containing protein [Candidatus Electryonea clarkiae]MDP8286440.1 PEP/pyruvate-binding domain-containing protein [Candidatus Electryonea clarkiae]